MSITQVRSSTIYDTITIRGSLTLPGNPTSALQAAPKQYVDSLNSGIVPSGSVMLFYQGAVPANWSLVNTLDDYALRVVNSTTQGGTANATGYSFSSVFSGSRVPTVTGGNTAGTIITIDQMPEHDHSVLTNTAGQHIHQANFNVPTPDITAPSSNTLTGVIVNVENVVYYDGLIEVQTNGDHAHQAYSLVTGNNQPHLHAVQMDGMNFAVQYVNVIICIKN